MAFQLAVSGLLPDDRQILHSIKEQFAFIQTHLPAGQGIQLLVSPSYTGREWISLLDVPEKDIFCFCKREDPQDYPACGSVLWQDTPLRSVLGEAMCDRADLVLAVWDEDVTQAAGASWEMIQLAHKEGTPCLWISAKSGAAYWSHESYYDPLSPAGLEKLCASHQTAAPEPVPDTEKSIPLLSLGAALRRRFLNKYRALQPQTAPEEDRILQDDFSLEAEGAGSEAVRRRILERYQRFDSAAINLNTQYQAIIYWRAILPFVASAFLAVGFYAEPLLSVTGMGSTSRAILAGTGFLIHGLLNLYVYFLSRNEGVREKHRAFLQNRCVAEILRLLIHLVPYGIYTDLRVMCGGSESLRAGIQSLTLDGEPVNMRLDGHSAGKALEHIHEMLADQIAYHNASAARFRRILDRMDKWYKVIFGAGFGVVLLRALLQFYVCISPLTGTINNADLNSFVRSAANMVALMLPAWASYFSSKISLCNFRFTYDNHVRMSQRLGQILAQVDTLRQMGASVPIDVLNSLSEQLAQAMIVEDTMTWERKLQSATVTQL